MGLRENLLKKFESLQNGESEYWNTDRLLSLIPPIDHALGGGFGYGRFSEIFGNYSTGKTMVGYKALISNQRRGGISMIIESEFAFDKTFFARLGGDPATVLVVDPDQTSTVEDVFQYVYDLCKEVIKLREDERTPIAIFWDGIAATSTRHLMKEGMDKRDLSKAGAITQGLSLITKPLKDAGICFIATNQTRERIDAAQTHDHSPRTPGGEAWKFMCSQRIQLQYDGTAKGSTIRFSTDAKNKDGELIIGRWIKGEVIKNKLATFGGRFNFSLYEEGYPHPRFDGHQTGFGIDVDESLWDYFLTGTYFVKDKERFIQKAGSYYRLHPDLYPDDKSFYEKEWLEVLAKHPEIRTLLYDDLEIDPPLYQGTFAQ